LRPIGPKIEPVKEPFELLQIDLLLDHLRVQPRPHKPLLLEPLAPETEPIPLPTERLDLVASPMVKTKSESPNKFKANSCSTRADSQSNNLRK